jgi:hypothetical protein
MSTLSATPAPAAAEQPQQQQPPAPTSIRLQTLDPSTTPHTTFTALFHLLTSAFGGSGNGSSPIWDNMYPPPRPSLDEQAAVGARQHAWEIRNRDVVYVVAVGTFPAGEGGGVVEEEEEERPVGLAVWGRPGYRWKPLVQREKMGQEEREAYEGYNLDFRNEWRGTLQLHRDQLMGDELYW